MSLKVAETCVFPCGGGGMREGKDRGGVYFMKQADMMKRVVEGAGGRLRGRLRSSE
jgi:hypothetical protein